MAGLEDYTSDNDLREENDNFWIKRIFKYVLLSVFTIIIFALSFWFLREVGINEAFRQEVLNTIWREISTIIVAGLAILGVSHKSKR